MGPDEEQRRFEQLVLAALIADPEVLPLASRRLTGADFSRPVHRETFLAIGRLAQRGVPISPEAIASEIDSVPERFETVGGMAALSRLVEGVPKGSPVEFWIDRVAESGRVRRVRDLLKLAEVPSVDTKRLREILRDADDALAEESRLPAAVSLSAIKACRPEFVVDGLSHRVGLRIIWGPPGGHKTHAMLRIIHELLLEQPPERLLGHPEMVIRRGYRRVLWVATEETGGVLRYKADMVLRGLGAKQLGGEIRYLFAADYRRRLTLDDLPEILEREAPVDQVVLDSLTGLRPRVVDGRRVQWDVDNESANDQCLKLRGLAEEHQLEITLVHHTSRDRMGYRGPIDWLASTDVMFGLVPQEGGLVQLKPEKCRDGALLKPFLLKPAWGPEGFYLDFAGESSGSGASMSPSEKRADEFLARAGEASQAEIMEGAEVKSRDTMTGIVRRRLASGAWEQTGARQSGSPVFRRKAEGGVQGVQ